MSTNSATSAKFLVQVQSTLQNHCEWVRSSANGCKSVHPHGSKVQIRDGAPVINFGALGRARYRGGRVAICFFEHVDTFGRTEVDGLLMELGLY